MGRIRPLWFFSAFALGLLACYILTPPPQLVVRFPSPMNAGSVTYQDGDDGCFAYDAEQVRCPADPSLVRPQPPPVAA